MKIKNDKIKLRVKRILNNNKDQSVKYLNGDEFLSISDWQYTFLFYLLDTIPEKINNNLSKTLAFLKGKTGFSLTELNAKLNDLKTLDLIKMDENKITKIYDRFLFQGREEEAAIDQLRVSFANSSKQLSETGAMSVYPREIDGKLLKKASCLANGINLVNWDFFVVNKDTAFAIEKLIESTYSDIQKICQDDIKENAEVYCMSSQFFKTSESLK